MSRGYIYHISKDPLAIPGIDESDFAEDIQSIGCDYVSNTDPSVVKENLETLKNRLRACGFSVMTENLPDDCAFSFITGKDLQLNECQKRWFEGKFRRFKGLAEKLTANEFSCGTSSVYQLETALHDRFSDAAYLDMGTGPAFYTFDRFMRTLEPETEYFVENACVYMH